MKAIDVVFSLDNTGSMSPCRAEAARRLVEVTNKLFTSLPNLRIGFMVHGDYEDYAQRYSYGKISDFYREHRLTNNTDELLDFISAIPNFHGHDEPECYEYVLWAASQFNWRVDAEKVLVVIGDEVPHDHATIRNYPDLLPKGFNELDAEREARTLADLGVIIYGVQALGKRHANYFYERLAKIGNGVKLELNQLSEINELIQAVCYKQDGVESLQAYQDELQAGGKLNRSIAAMLAKLGGKATSLATDRDLHAVEPTRFQVLHVDDRVSIKDFVESTGATFRKGKGFYEFTKREEIQERKEVVLRDKKTGDMYSGEKAREMIGVPYGQRDTVRPVQLAQYDVFIQSTSNNRVLMPNTRFLYENSR